MVFRFVMSKICLQLVKEAGAFVVATALSCGPSQLFGLIKLVVDARLLLVNNSRKNKLISDRQKCHKDWRTFQTSPAACLIAKKLGIEVSDLTQDAAQKYFDTKNRKVEGKLKKLGRSLRADLWALVPLIGAHISWRVATDYKGKSFTPIFSRATQQLLEHSKHVASRPLFWGRQPKEPSLDAAPGLGTIDVSVSTKKRRIKIYHDLAYELNDKGEFVRGKYVENQNKIKRPTVVLFHPNEDGVDTTAAAHMDERAQLYRKKGYNTLAVTLGGYEGSPGVTTSEKSMYQDIEAVKRFLEKLGVEKVAYHGFSLGSGAAMQAAVGESSTNLKTMFVVLDQPYTSVGAIGENVASGLGKGVMCAGCPAGLDVELPGGLWTKTDGLNNLEKAVQLKKKNIPLICIEVEEDFLMGRNKKKGKYTENFARDLMKARYGDSPEQTQNLVTRKGKHGYNALAFTQEWNTALIPSRRIKNFK